MALDTINKIREDNNQWFLDEDLDQGERNQDHRSMFTRIKLWILLPLS